MILKVLAAIHFFCCRLANCAVSLDSDSCLLCRIVENLIHHRLDVFILDLHGREENRLWRKCLSSQTDFIIISCAIIFKYGVIINHTVTQAALKHFLVLCTAFCDFIWFHTFTHSFRICLRLLYSLCQFLWIGWCLRICIAGIYLLTPCQSQEHYQQHK